MLNLNQIFPVLPNPENQYVSYQNFLRPRVDFHDLHSGQLFDSHKEKIMQIVRTELSDYLNDEDLCNDDEDMFPRRCVLTGEWYICELISFDHESGIMFTVRTAFLGTDLGDPDDYLGLEVNLYYDPKTENFLPYGINSEAI